MIKTSTYIKEWQQALQSEINYLKKFSQTKIALYNGKFLNTEEEYTYYFETSSYTKIPIGSTIVLEWGTVKINGRILSSDGKSLLVVLEKSIGDSVSEAYLFHDPWELLEQLMIRFDSIKENKRKRRRIYCLMNPTMDPKHPVEGIKNHVHELALRCKYNPVTFVWGPPGTGKTYTLARVALQRYWKGKRILILSHSNQAVDVLIKEITSTSKNKGRFKLGDILRYGSNTSDGLLGDEQVTTSTLLVEKERHLSVEKNQLTEEKKQLKMVLANSFSNRDSSSLLKLEEKLALVLEKIRKREVQFVKKAMIIGTTLAKAATDPTIYEEEFDLVLVDEASMAYVPQAAFAATLGKRIIICGDFKQLPPIAAGRNELVDKWLKEDIFSAANVAESVSSNQLHAHLLLLNEQRRMHPHISSFTNQYIYHSLVGDHRTVLQKREQIADKQPFKNIANILLDTSHYGAYGTIEKGSNSRWNVMHLVLSLQVIYEGLMDGAASIGYVTPYRAQAELMSGLIEEFFPKELAAGIVAAATVHRFQGSEKDIIVFDTVDSTSHERPGMLLVGKDSERLINVAITRTKGKFIHISHCNFLKRKVGYRKTIRQLIEHQEKHYTKVTPKQIGTWVNKQSPSLLWMHAKQLDKVFADIKSAKHSITIALPQNTSLPFEWIEQLEKTKKTVVVTYFGPSLQLERPYDRKQWNDIPFPIIIIDEQIIWLGHPLESVIGSLPPSIAVRMHSIFLAQYMLKQLVQ
ncbi:AAA domain-containing protein [Niallia sp. 01092]|uniref:AAA domain-containing protein n=1 Tax=unclassified Niallia TaxID=2837522 RepID=UPI003FD1A712